MMVPDMLQVLILAVVFGGALMLVQVAPIDATVKQIARVVLICVAVIWALRWLLGRVE